MTAITPRVYTRRDFLGHGLLAVSAAVTMPLFLDRAASAAELAAEAAPAPGSGAPGLSEDRVLVVVQLSGGNDGLNTVVPFGAPEYYRARPRLAIAESDAIPLDLDLGLGLHPALRPIHEMLEQRQASIVQGVGYPNPDRSHSASLTIYHQADPARQSRSGWIGRAMDQRHQAAANAAATMAMGAFDIPACVGAASSPVVVNEPELFRWAGWNTPPTLVERFEQLSDLSSNSIAEQAHSMDADLAFIRRTQAGALVAADKVRQAAARRPDQRFPSGPLGAQLQMVASCLAAEVPARVFYVHLDGFDHHAHQAHSHAALLSQFARSIQAFYRELDALGQSNRVLTLAFTEFGRRVAENASGGTDHGTASPAFLFGPMVAPGLVGRAPSLRDGELNDGDLEHTVDFRSVYAAVLDNWMNIESSRILGRRFEPADVLASVTQ